jgi:hypothetical protein
MRPLIGIIRIWNKGLPFQMLFACNYVNPDDARLKLWEYITNSPWKGSCHGGIIGMVDYLIKANSDEYLIGRLIWYAMNSISYDVRTNMGQYILNRAPKYARYVSRYDNILGRCTNILTYDELLFYTYKEQHNKFISKLAELYNFTGKLDAIPTKIPIRNRWPSENYIEWLSQMRPSINEVIDMLANGPPMSAELAAIYS